MILEGILHGGTIILKYLKAEFKYRKSMLKNFNWKPSSRNSCGKEAIKSKMHRFYLNFCNKSFRFAHIYLLVFQKKIFSTPSFMILEFNRFVFYIFQLKKLQKSEDAPNISKRKKKTKTISYNSFLTPIPEFNIHNIFFFIYHVSFYCLFCFDFTLFKNNSETHSSLRYHEIFTHQ